MKKQNNENKCSFCGLNQSEAYKLIAGPNIFICDGCVKTAYNLIFREKEKTDPSSKAKKLKS